MKYRSNVRRALCMRRKLKGTSRHPGQDNVVVDETDPNPGVAKGHKGQAISHRKLSDVLNLSVRSLK